MQTISNIVSNSVAICFKTVQDITVLVERCVKWESHWLLTVVFPILTFIEEYLNQIKSDAGHYWVFITRRSGKNKYNTKATNAIKSHQS